MTRLHHIALGARDVERVGTFYREAFALTEVARHHAPDGSLRSLWLDLEGTVLMVERCSETPRRVEGVSAGPFLLAVRVAPHERDAVEARLTSLGAPIESRTQFSAYARDPEGNRIALSHWPEAAA